MHHYVLGFAFDTNCRVALIRKNRPQWQAGRWNGIGGKVEAGESPTAAMIREFEEETGVVSPGEVWQHFATLRDKRLEFEMTCFVTVLQPEQLDLVRTVESEEVRIFDGDVLTREDIDVLPNLRWILPMALCLTESDIPVLVEFGHSLTVDA
jgi:8-oxo-dGTP diphosphatase